MSVTTSQEHSYLKVLFDFQYKTAEGREIIIRKNERLYLLQKTNADWWQVVRNLEQRSFYVPASYVRETSKSSGSSTIKNSEEERDTIFEPPQDPSYKSMPKESSSAMRNVKKWLANAIDSKSEPPKMHESEAPAKYDEPGSKSRLRVGLGDTKTKSLERDRRSGHFSDREDDGTNGSPRSRDSGEYHENANRISNRLSTSPKGSGLQYRMEAALQDPFRRELESSLDRRNLGVKLGGRLRTSSMNSEGSNVESDGGDSREASDKTEKETRQERRSNLSIHEESPHESRTSSRNSRSLDAEGGNKRAERSTSPKPIYARQMTIAGGSADRKISTTEGGPSDHKILNDKRRTWAVEELMSELTQMCKERGTTKKPTFQLESTEVKGNFDPLEKLTREIHEMNRMRSETSTTEGIDVPTRNICKIAINSSIPVSPDHQIPQDSIPRNKQSENSHKMAKSTNLPELEADSVLSSSPKALKSPKSPKILDEYNEANILSDFNSSEAPLRSPLQRSLSPDKQSHYQKRSSPAHASGETRTNEPYYSNVKFNAEKVKARAKLKLKMVEPGTELKLTPSLEKLASEIQFLPAKRSSRTEKSGNPEDLDVEKSYEEIPHSDDSLDRRERLEVSRTSEPKLRYKGSFKTRHETRHREREKRGDELAEEKATVKKSSTFNCATVPECYRRFRRCDFVDRFEPVLENFSSSAYKRRSRSLSDLEAMEMKFYEEDVKRAEQTRMPKSKPVPLPRTKIPAVTIRESPSLGSSGLETSMNLGDHDTPVSSRNNLGKMPPRIIPEPRKLSKDKTEEENDWEANKQHDPTIFSNLDKRNVNIESSTAVGFKSLLCASDSGSDNCLQSKELLSSSADNLNDRGSLKSARKSHSSSNFNDRSRITRESLSDDQILSSNASSEALHSESEITPTFDVLSQANHSPITATASQDSFECAIDLPPGWKQTYDSDIGQICFLNEQGDKWFSSSDAEGKIYFFEENSNESSWVLPPMGSGKSPSNSMDEKKERVDLDRSASDKEETGSARSNVQPNQSMGSRELSTKKMPPMSGDWPHLCDGNHMLVLKEGVVNRTKITENGKKLRKNWSTSYAVLTELFLLFFKDSKTFSMMKTGQSSMAKPDISVDLNGALVEPGDRASSRKNVYMISTVLGLQVLVQSDNTAVATEWFQEIHAAIRKLPSSFKSQGKPLPITNEPRKTSGGKQPTEMNHQEETKKSNKIARSRSMKMKRLDDSLEDLSGSAAERQTKIKAKLRRFFLRRPAVELLVKNGIYKDEPAFGSYLSDVCPPESPRVPLFVKTCIEVLESNEENMKTDGLYRASGNLSQIQKIRLQVDQYKLDVLAQEEDVHVLAGALKLFFRELKEPLIPSSFFKEAVNASMLKKNSAKIQCFREIVKALPPPNYDTLQFLLKHLLRVTSYQEFNRMHIPNLAIVFGPTLMWPAEESANMALDFMQQNLVIECLLSEYNKIFK